MKSLTWLERIISVFDLRREADLTEIYDVIEKKWPEVLTKRWQATVRKEIETHCRSSANFKGEKFLFGWDRDDTALCRRADLMITTLASSLPGLASGTCGVGRGAWLVWP